jgi:23S rRNA pseudouridine1911/1915/1917 synthase
VALNRGWSYRERIGPVGAGRSVLSHLVVTRPHTSEADWRARVDGGEVEIDGRPARPEDRLRPGVELAWHRPPWDEPEVPLHFDVLHEDATLVVVDKPSGLPTLPAGGFLAHTLLTVLRARYPDASPVHRLGRFTSGVVVCARTADAAARLGAAWQTPAVEKRYRALVDGRPDWDTRHIRVPIGPVPHPRLGSVHAAHAGGRPADSAVTVRERRAGTTLCDVAIATGRPHQIRIHLAWAGHPLAGDPLYAPGGLPRALAPGLPGDGGYLLHALRVRFAHPASGATTIIEAPLPEALRCR